MRVGIVGGGQLGRMLALAGYPLGLRFRCLEPYEDAPMAHLADLELGAYDDADALLRFARRVDVVTYEFENVPVASARQLERHVPVFPPPAALEVAQDRLREKTTFLDLGIPVPRFAAVDSRADLAHALAAIGAPAVLKTRRFGYDGKGQFVIRQPQDADAAWAALGDAPLLLEGFVEFRRELSVLAVRGRGGETAFYPLVENRHREGILRVSRAPAPGVSPALQALAERHATAVLESLGYVGVLAIEFFEVSDAGGSRLLANEMAPRVHNSGHWTIEGAETSQFENHLRAVLGLPLGPTTPRGHSVMLNVIGTAPDAARILAIPGAHLHLYGKTPRAGRKLGHVTVRADGAEAARAAADRVMSLLEG
ncbi:MAG TPA: 5-(carboxyamino)imidazole ribonucleotide synthase [Longimicrobiales bacterium]|nr:5-(carboxyamino)imidazole ribonucleotide synthase [Longimicrobiales bacterium]